MAKSFCEQCIHYDICKINDEYSSEDTVTWFPHNKDCPQFANKNDYVKVRHGKWEFIGDSCAKCTNCGTIFEALPTKYAFERNNLYCRHCGTPMDGGNVIE